MKKAHEAAETFSSGDIVEWTSAANGSERRKEGQVVQVFQPGTVPTKEEISASGMPRDHVSYLINAYGRLFWPRVNAKLKLVKRGSAA